MAPSLSKPLEAFASATSAGLGGCCSTVLLYPLDTIKTRLQSGSKDFNTDALYRGVQYKMVQSSTAKFLYFYYYSILSTWMIKRKKSLDTITSLGIGYLAEAMHLPITIPIENIATKMQTSGADDGIWQTIQAIYQQNGNFSSFFMGWETYSVLCLQPAIQYTIFEQIKKKKEKLSLLEAFLYGAISRAIATLIVYPYIRAKVVLQSSVEKRRVLEAIYLIFKQQGVVGIYRGIVPEITRGALSSAVMLMLKEKIHIYTRRVLLTL